VEPVIDYARRFSLGRRLPLVIVPMQTLQLLGGPRGRARFLRRARAHLEPGGRLAAAVADAIDCFDEAHPLPPPPDVRDVAGVRYASTLLGVAGEDGAAVIHRRREIVGPSERRESREVTVRLDRVPAGAVAAEAGRLGFSREPDRHVPATEEYLGSTVVVLRAS
jgi:hypothetical protein